MRATVTWTTLVLILATCAQPMAQVRRKSLAEMNTEELREAKFEWESRSAFQGSATAGAIAAGPGLVFHGFGHFYSGDAETGWDLLLGEGIGLALGLVGYVIVAASDESSTFNDVGVGVGHLGGTLFATGWFIDIIGSLQGNQSELPAPSLRRVPGEATGRYRFLRTDNFDAFHLIEAELMFDFGVVYLRPRTLQDALLNYQEYGGDFGLRVVEGVDQRDYLALELEVDWANFRPDSGAQVLSESGRIMANPLRVDLSVDVSLDLSTFVNHLKHAVQRVVFGIGFGRDVGARSFFPGEREKTWLHYEHHLYVNIGRDLVLHPFYEFNESNPVEPISNSLGVFGTVLHIVPRKGLTLDLSVAVGNGVTTAAGISYRMF